MRPMIKTVAANQASNLATSIINETINEVMLDESLTYTDLITVEKDDDGRITAVKTDIITINRLRAQVSAQCVEKISQIHNREIKVPIGSLMGSEFLVGRGPNIKIYINLTGSVETQVRNDLSSAGINQTSHKIMLDISADINIIFSKNQTTSNVDTSMIIAETVIVGVVPDTYADLGMLASQPSQK
jgi:sporulation protein YunB